MKPKTVFVSGCFDLLHLGHVKFLEAAARLGRLHVGIGSDETVKELKGAYPVNGQEERKAMLVGLKCVWGCTVNIYSGMLDFQTDLVIHKPDIFFVGKDGDHPDKRALCKKLGIKYVVWQGEKVPGFSSTRFRGESTIPYRLDLAGGWLDQPFVSKLCPGPVITLCIEPQDFAERSGLASSTRRKAVELWGPHLPQGDPEKLAKTLFAYENPPGTREFSGSQDAIGIVYPGLNRLEYDGDYWPWEIKTHKSETTFRWLEKHIRLYPIGARQAGFDVFDQRSVSTGWSNVLSVTSQECWTAILNMNLKAFGVAVSASFKAQTVMFPAMLSGGARDAIADFKGEYLGLKLSGAGGGGYLVLVVDHDIAGTIKIKVRRKGEL